MKDIKNVLRALAALVLATAMFTATADASHGGNVHCGDTLTANTTLTGNVVDATTGGPCSGHGVIIGASGITLDLAGFKIVGDADAEGADAGVHVSGYDNATITDSTATAYDAATARWNGSNEITGFENGVQLVDGANSNTVEKLNIVGNAGLDLNGEGVLVYKSDSNTIKGNVIVGNGPYAGITLLDDSDSNVIGVSGTGGGNLVASNAVTHQDIGVRLESGTTGTPSEPDSCTDSNTVEWNRISGSTIDGVSVLNGNKCDSTGNTIADNAIFGNGRDGVRLNARCFNDSNGTAALPCNTTGATNTVPHGALSNTVDDNSVCNNGGAGIRVTAAGTGNTISNNQAGDGATMDHGPSIPCLPNNPVTVASPVASPLLPPHGDLIDGNGNCTYNTWTNNTYTTKSPSCIN